MNARVSALNRYAAKGASGQALSEAVLVRGQGMQGDRHQGGGERQISLLLTEARRWMDDQPEPGLCFGRFKPNIVIDGLSSGDLSEGSCLSIGDGAALLRIGADAKRCFPECALFSSGAPCRLAGCAGSPGGTAFAVVERGGVVRVGDAISIHR